MIEESVLTAVAATGVDPRKVAEVVTTALAEDLSDGPDVTTTATIPAEQTGTAFAVARERGVVAGLPVAALVFAIVGEGRLESEILLSDGEVVAAGQRLLRVSGPLRDILTAERTALNLLTHLSGVASLTRRWVAAVEGSGAQIRDTRKTMPGLRALEKYAVRCGGGINHRMSLSDAALIKDNHVAAAGSVARAFELVQAAARPGLAIEVEVDTIEQCQEAAAAGAELILLDNMAPALMRRCVDLVAKAGSGARLEASGGLSLDNAAEVAASGVHYLAVGALTHSAPVLDIGLDLLD
ncbi:MAG: carboxylating nicotinate-nucleotide diphosphorylase [Frankiales bacterium]|nr:carboxylating nicotinate-nucleotide diphosphorylase [Frankiales bacterium]